MVFPGFTKVRPWRVAVSAMIIFLLLLAAEKIGHEPDGEKAPNKNTTASGKQR